MFATHYNHNSEDMGHKIAIENNFLKMKSGPITFKED
jgi:hypothetical protein